MKFLLLFSLLIGLSLDVKATTSDRFLMKIVDRAISFQDISYQLRNMKALDCAYSDSIVVEYFQKKFIKELEEFVANFPIHEGEVVKYMHSHVETLKSIRFFFKMLRYSEDQNKVISPELAQLIKDSSKENRCQTEILYNDSLKSNFSRLLEMELYLRSRYEGQLRGLKRSFSVIRSSMDLFIESLDKQFGHEYYW